MKDEKLHELAEKIDKIIRQHVEENETTYAGIIGTLFLMVEDFKEEAKASE